MNTKVFGGNIGRKIYQRFDFAFKCLHIRFFYDICDPLNSQFINIAVRNNPYLEGLQFTSLRSQFRSANYYNLTK